MDLEGLELQVKMLTKQVASMEEKIKIIKRRLSLLADLDDRVLCLENSLNYEVCEQEAKKERDAEYREADEKLEKEFIEKYPDPQRRPLVMNLTPRPAPDVHGFIVRKIYDKGKKSK